MNFLAHLHVAAPVRGLMLGGVLADLLKPAEIATLPADVRDGVRLHRLVDGFTDRHPVVQRSIRRVSDGLGWFSGIVVDVYFDHLLARTWGDYAAEPLRDFADRCYALFRDAAPGLPAEGQRFAHHFAADDRLVRYGTADGIADTLDRVSARIAARMPTRAVRLRDAMPALLGRRSGRQGSRTTGERDQLRVELAEVGREVGVGGVTVQSASPPPEDRPCPS